MVNIVTKWPLVTKSIRYRVALSTCGHIFLCLPLSIANKWTLWNGQSFNRIRSHLFQVISNRVGPNCSIIFFFAHSEWLISENLRFKNQTLMIHTISFCLLSMDCSLNFYSFIACDCNCNVYYWLAFSFQSNQITNHMCHSDTASAFPHLICLRFNILPIRNGNKSTEIEFVYFN